MNRKILVAAICTSLMAPSMASAGAPSPQVDTTSSQQANAPGEAQTAKKKPVELQAVTVTGSLIPQAQVETANPVIQITAHDIKMKGFTSVYDVLRSLPLATGQVQGQQNTNGFTPGARTISLLGLPPDFTLVMVDGHPMADYPLLYNGTANFNDISSIPVGMIQSIQIVPGNQSSIYGSAAIAGVINIILKKNIEGTNLNFQAGGYHRGGGSSQQLELTGGYSAPRASVTYGVQFKNQQPLWAFQRPYTASTYSNPVADLRGIPELNDYVYDYDADGGNGAYLDPNTITTAGCAPLTPQFGGTTVRGPAMNPGATPIDFEPTGGYGCGSPYTVGYTTLQNRMRTASAYLKASYQLSDNASLYGTLLYNYSNNLTGQYQGYTFWNPNETAQFEPGGFPGAIFNADTGTIQNPVYTFSPENVGSVWEDPIRNINRAYDFWGGVKGSLWNSDWEYDAFYARSQSNVFSGEGVQLTSRIDAFFQQQFLGPQLGTTSGMPIYKPNYDNFFQMVTPAQYNSFSTLHEGISAESYTENVNLHVTNSRLLSLPAGDVGFAGVLQYGNQKWTMPVDPLLASHEAFGLSGTSGGGTRENYATAVEVRVPIFPILDVDVSGRFDHFHNDGGSSSSRPTYKIAFALRPTDRLLLRANYATAFRMPDMGYVFIGPSTSFVDVTDYYQCELKNPGTPFSSCSGFSSATINPDILQTQIGNAQLKPITAKSWGGGVVWSPVPDFEVKADYYDVRIHNEVQYQSFDSILQTEAQCLLGQLDLSSPACVQAVGAVGRAPATGPIPLLLTGVSVQPVNIASERVSGITASLRYSLNAGRFGDWTIDTQYNVSLHHDLQPGPGFPNYDLLHNPYYDFLYSQGGSALGPEFKTITQATLSWSLANWQAALTGVRYGKLPNIAVYSNPTQNQSFGAAVLPPWILYNATLTYSPSDRISITGTLDNLFDKMPPRDMMYQSWPYYDIGAYNVRGRAYYLAVNVKL